MIKMEFVHMIVMWPSEVMVRMLPRNISKKSDRRNLVLSINWLKQFLGKNSARFSYFHCIQYLSVKTIIIRLWVIGSLYTSSCILKILSDLLVLWMCRECFEFSKISCTFQMKNPNKCLVILCICKRLYFKYNSFGAIMAIWKLQFRWNWCIFRCPLTLW